LDGRRHFSPPGLAAAGLFMFPGLMARALRRFGIPPRYSLSPAGTAARGLFVRVNDPSAFALIAKAGAHDEEQVDDPG
jgi:hypothetical protein